MNLSTFDAFSFDEQLQIIRSRGTYLMTRRGRKGRISLYQVGPFYAEVWYDSEDTYVKLVRGFACATFLEPYLEKILVPDLYAPLK
jgi:hypothetical protein